jgi:tetratricopeptide (TPR) repeat protein
MQRAFGKAPGESLEAPMDAPLSNDNEAVIGRARRLLQDKKFEESARVWRELIQKNPKDAESMNELGSALTHAGRFEEGLQWFRRSLEIRPDLNAAKVNAGVALRHLNRPEEAVSSLRDAVASNPDDAAACFNLGVTLKSLERLEEALIWLRRASELRPSHRESLQELGRVLQALKRNHEAIQTYGRAHSLQRDCIQTLMSLGGLLQEVRQFQEAAAAFQKAVSVDPDFCDGWLSLGAALLGARRHADSLAAFRRAIALQPGSAVAYCNMSLALLDLGRVEEAIDACRKAVFIEPGSAVGTFNLGCMLLALGNFREGWEAYDYRFALGTEKWLREDAHAAPWTGEPLQHKSILILGEQGNGDHLQFCRYLAALSDLGASVTYLAPARLHRLFRTLRGSIKLLDELPQGSRFDFQCPLMHLPGLFNRLGYPMPTSTPYLAAEPERVSRWKNHIGDHGFRIGVVWQGNNYNGDDLRSYPLDALRPLAKISNVRLISLQIKEGTEQLRSLPSDMQVETLPDFDQGEDGFLDSAAAIDVVDLVVTCDTSMVHLAGALGRPVWIALNDTAEWRWQRQRSDSIWYPTARLFRQRARGDWDKVFLDMAKAVTHLLKTSADSSTSHALTPSKLPPVEVSWGELLDKISILEIKSERMRQAASLANVKRELEYLRSVLDDFGPLPPEIDRERASLRAVNEMLWDLEDAVRDCEAKQSFNENFVKFAREIYAFNDQRAGIKKQINVLMKSSLVEEKEFSSRTV